MKTFIYVRAEVHPDITGSISFEHAFISATNEAEAYGTGAEKLPPPKQAWVCNDYVVEVPSQS